MPHKSDYPMMPKGKGKSKRAKMLAKKIYK